ncbi:acyl-CoA dehydrogenase family protein [Nocardia alni]|uniref:acyl-CoA dehydrogenase family protein n=1 Tax=Nocardia alni TaxID=2815723 RepID=UPI001C22C504|nr:acyl-CoA dehydrogenase family protein [Nocardia alni]
MTFTLTEEQRELRAVVRRFLAEQAPGEQVRRWMASEPGHDPELWRRMAGELGLNGLAVPQEYGGSGCGSVELGIVLEELGRALVPSPYFATVALAGQALTACADSAARARWLPGIVDGSSTATLAVAEESGGLLIEDVTTAAVDTGAGWTVSGTKMFVIDGHTADLLLILARTEAGPALFAVGGDAAGVTRTRLETLDPTRQLARIDLVEAPARPIDTPGEAYLRAVLDLAVTALAAEQIGGAQACLDAAVRHARTRVQFDRPIGSFQAIKHKCANLLVELEGARAAVDHAASVAAAGSAEFPLAAALAAASASAAFTHAAKENIQIHGGIGYTWEHDAHLYLKRAKTSEHLFGGPALFRSRVADLAGI